MYTRALLSMILLTYGSPLTAQEAAEEPELGWFDTAEFTFVTTNGNAEAETLGFKNTLLRRWENATFQLEAGGLRAESTTVTRRAVGPTANDFQVLEEATSELTAESYYLRGRYDRQWTDKRFWYAGGGWERNEFAGIDNRYTLSGGIGHNLWQRDESHFLLSYGLTYTHQDDLVPAADADDSFLGLRGSWDYLRQLTGNTTYSNLLVVDQNLEESDDLRADLLQSLAVAMNDKLALKLSWQLLYDRMPSLTAVPLQLPDGTATGQTVSVELEELDSLIQAALVVNF